MRRCAIARLRPAAAVLATIAATLAVSPASADGEALSERLGETIPARLAADGVAGLVVVLIEGGTPVWTAAFGTADPAAGRPLTADALFRVESLSKPVTAWSAMRLAETGRLDLDAPVANCLHRWRRPPEAGEITPRALLTHTAGIDLGDFSQRFAPGAAMPDLPAHVAQDFQVMPAAGGHFSYSYTGYNLLELVVEDCVGEQFADFMVREVLAPLGMTRAGFVPTGVEMPVGHDLHGRPVAPYVYPAHASGGLLATATDMARFAAAGMAGARQDVLTADGVASLHHPAVAVGGLFGRVAEGYGLGHFTETLSDGRRAVWHGGQGYDWISHMHLVPETGAGIVPLSNSQRAWPLFAAILRDWSDSLGVEPVGMVRILLAEQAARIAIALAFATAGLAFWRAFRGCRPAPALRLVVGGVAAGLILWPAWAANRDYLFLFSSLPGLWPWLGAGSVVAGAGLLALSLAPGRRS
ncbi:MAG: serine hydrolase domain-containing protein [Tabrizicola sp.]